MSTAVVIDTASALSAEEQLVARRLAGVLVGAGADLFVATSSEPAWEVGLPGGRFLVDAGRALRRRALSGALLAASADSCGCVDPGTAAVSPAVETAWLTATGGTSPALLQAVAGGGYDRVVIIGLSSAVAIDLAERQDGETVIAPLGIPGPSAFPRGYRALARAAATLAVSSGEAARLEAAGARHVLDVGFALRAGTGTDEGHPGAPSGDYVLVAGEWDDDNRGHLLRRRAARLARQLRRQRDIDVVLLTEEFIYPHAWPYELVVRPGGSRRDLWQWTVGATAVVDLDPSRYLARDVAEALLCGAPVIVPEGSAGHDHVRACGGGVWFRNLEDVSAAIGLIAGDARDIDTRRSRERAEDRFDPEAFAARVLDAAGAPVAAR